MGIHNIEIVRGDDFSSDITFKLDGVVMNITGSTVMFTIKRRVTDSDANAMYSQTVTIHKNPTSGITTISIPDTITTTFDPGDYVYDIQYVAATTGYVTTPVRGTFKVNADTTRRIT